MSENKPRRRAQAARAAQKSASRKSGLSRVMLVAMMMVLVAVVSIGGTMAWLQAQSETIVNTFTTSDINIKLEETTGNEYQMIPGGSITKNPKVTVLEGSEDCWLFVELTKSDNFDDFLIYHINDQIWKPVGTEYPNIYYCEVPKDADIGTPIDVLVQPASLTVKGEEVTKGMMKDIIDDPSLKPTLTVQAYAVQSANLPEGTDAVAAWALAKPANSGEGTNP